jgi:hypothetical protein
VDININIYILYSSMYVYIYIYVCVHYMYVCACVLFLYVNHGCTMDTTCGVYKICHLGVKMGYSHFAGVNEDQQIQPIFR